MSILFCFRTVETSMKYWSLLFLFYVALVGSSEGIVNGRSYYRKRRNLVFPGGGQILVKKFWLEILRTETRFVELPTCNLVVIR